MAMRQKVVPILASNSVAGPDGDAYTYITPQGSCRRMEIFECAPANFDGTNFNPVGLTYKLPADNFTQVFGAEPGEHIVLEDYIEEGNGGSRMLGFPARPDPGGRGNIPATTIIKIASAAVTATQVIVKEWS